MECINVQFPAIFNLQDLFIHDGQYVPNIIEISKLRQKQPLDPSDLYSFNIMTQRLQYWYNPYQNDQIKLSEHEPNFVTTD